MRVFSFLISGLAHVAIVMAAIVGLPSLYERSDDYVMIPVEILEIGDETNVRAAAMEMANEPEPPKVQEKEEPRYAEAPPPPPPMSEPVPQDAMPPLPKEDTPRAKPVETKKIIKKSMPRRKPSPPRKKSKNDDLDLDALEALLDKAPKEEPKPRAVQSDDALDSLDDFLAEDPSDLPRQAIGLGTGLTISEIAALRQEIQKCWRPPTGAANPEELIVDLIIYLREDGTLLRAPKVERSGTSSFGSNSFAQAAERAALAAVNKCAPYDFLPIDKYERWKVVTITFDPAKMIGY